MKLIVDISLNKIEDIKSILSDLGTQHMEYEDKLRDKYKTDSGDYFVLRRECSQTEMKKLCEYMQKTEALSELLKQMR